ncbi:hypothetical protein [Deinococcus radiophilus]|uniref:Lipoprotein n=1 Tax=Deinococcus radiophilus TaxID=32062 RepID=A0A3S0I5N6_9DEIO|nr:hypothetical protein [Deinococcus radiophilus]RTR25713.1 hypothetical protein EJ104_09790 [Deinococcus radiophilus]UFA50214.1 hypothetical protein LMT64_10100 [Deinococcus radiophilus]
MNRLLFPAALGLMLTACTPAMTAPDLTGSPLVTGQEWTMLSPAAGGNLQLSRQLTVGERELQTDGTVQYRTAPITTVTGKTEDLFRFLPLGQGRSVIVAGRSETTFDLRFFDFCVVRSDSASVNELLSGVYVQTATLEGLALNRAYQSYVNTGVAAGLPACTLTRVK